MILFQQSPIHKIGFLIINLPKPYCTLKHLCACVRSSTYSELTVMHTSAHGDARAYIAYACLIPLRQSLQLNWAFLKALIGPFWPNYQTLIQINPNGSLKYTKRAVRKWLLFTFTPFFSSILK